MKTFAIRDEESKNKKDLAHLIYFEKDKKFYIELPDNADFWETPLILSSFLKRGQRSIDSHWSKIWVQQRIVPTDRQNLGQILKANGLDEYDEFKLLMLANGRCSQDNYYLVKIDLEVMQDLYKDRINKRVDMVVPLPEYQLLVCFRNGKTKKCSINALAGENRLFRRVLSDSDIFDKVAIQTGGYGVCWGEQLMLSDWALYDAGIDVPLDKNDLVSIIKGQVVNSLEAADILNCSRQYINELSAKGKLTPIKSDAKTTLYLRSEVMQKSWQ